MLATFMEIQAPSPTKARKIVGGVQIYLARLVDFEMGTVGKFENGREKQNQKGFRCKIESLE